MISVIKPKEQEHLNVHNTAHLGIMKTLKSCPQQHEKILVEVADKAATIAASTEAIYQKYMYIVNKNTYRSLQASHLDVIKINQS
jgi:hypothetical protein